MTSLERSLHSSKDSAQGDETLVERCEEHGLAANFYCRNCQEAICQFGLKDAHRPHDVANIDEEREDMVEILFANAESALRELKSGNVKNFSRKGRCAEEKC